MAAVNLTCPFKLRDLDKLKAGTDLPVFKHLEPYIIELKERLGLEDRSRLEIMFSAEKGDINPLQTIFIRWMNSHSSIKPTWKNLIQFLDEFKEEKFAERLKLYLTSVPEHITTKKTVESELQRLCPLLYAFQHLICVYYNSMPAYVCLCECVSDSVSVTVTVCIIKCVCVFT